MWNITVCSAYLNLALASASASASSLWPWTQPRPQVFGLGLKHLASFNISGTQYKLYNSWLWHIVVLWMKKRNVPRSNEWYVRFTSSVALTAAVFWTLWSFPPGFDLFFLLLYHKQKILEIHFNGILNFNSYTKTSMLYNSWEHP